MSEAWDAPSSLNSSRYSTRYFSGGITPSAVRSRAVFRGNQRMIVENYCRQNGITLVREFVDDGYSGGNFNRPGLVKRCLSSRSLR